MPTCNECKDVVDELVSVKLGPKSRKVCEDCADLLREQREIAEMSEDAVRDMMDYKGSW